MPNSFGFGKIPVIFVRSYNKFEANSNYVTNIRAALQGLKDLSLAGPTEILLFEVYFPDSW